MSIHDISIAIGEGTPEWPGDTPYSCRWTWEIARGDSVNVSEIRSSPHVGTHADAPLHVRDDWPASHALPLEPFLGRAFVLSVDPSLPLIEPAHLAPLPSAPLERLLLRSGRSIATGPFPDSWPALSDASLRLLLDRGLRLLGVDSPSVDARTSTTLEIHEALFAGGAYNIENLDLRGIDDGEYELIAVPLKILSADAAPVRALLRSL
ncbi:MAG TPA: cyclase family protein [Gemmatimonadaceae bacterium]|nr:cyclase family protein [Gemmatimonadaceae bacterium]